MCFTVCLWKADCTAMGVFSLFHTDGTAYIDLHDFNGTDGAWPDRSTLTLYGKTLFGYTNFGGDSSGGDVFSIDTNGNNFKVLYSFGNSTATNPAGQMAVSGNKLYGTSALGFVNLWGIIFSMDTDGSNFTIIHSFDSIHGGWPEFQLH